MYDDSKYSFTRAKYFEVCEGGGSPLSVTPNPSNGQFEIQFQNTIEMEEYFNRNDEALTVEIIHLETIELIYRDKIKLEGLTINLSKARKGH